MTSFDSIWEEFSLPLRTFIKRRIDNEQDTEDILQIVFLKIHNNISSLKETTRLQPWIYTITKNTICDFYRSKKHDIHIESLPEDIFSSKQEELTVNNEISQCLNVMMQNLPDKYKQALILTEFENLTQKEAAQRMGLSVSGAKSRVQRARSQLKLNLLNCCSIERDRRGNIIDYKVMNKDCNYC